MHSIFKKNALDSFGEEVVGRDYGFILAHLILPVKKKILRSAFPSTISKLGRCEISQNIGCSNDTFGGSMLIGNKILVEFLGVIVMFMCPNESLPLTC